MPPRKPQPRRPPARRSGAQPDSDVASVPDLTASGSSANERIADISSLQETTPRAPVQRLDSLSRRNNVQSTTRDGGGTADAKALKFQPKRIIRRSKEEREAIERAELEKQQARLAAQNETKLDPSVRGGFQGRGRGRGRGGARSGPGSKREEGMASGPFALGSVTSGPSTQGYNKISRRTAGTRTSFPSSKPKRDSGKDNTGDLTSGEHTLKSESFGDSSSEDFSADEAPRMNIEQINLVSDDEADGPVPGNKRRISTRPAMLTTNLRPVRLDRMEHIDRTTAVNTEASSSTSAELRKRAQEKGEDMGLFIPETDADSEDIKLKEKSKGVELPGEREWKGVYDDEPGEEAFGVRIKDEPGEEHPSDIMDIAEAHAKAVSQTTAEQPVTTVNATTTHEHSAENIPSSPELHQKLKPKTNFRRRQSKSTPLERKPVLQTEEDRAEWARYEHDVRILKEELGTLHPHLDRVDESMDTTDGDQAQQKTKETHDPKEGKLYLFQFPPLLPGLEHTGGIKSEPLDSADLMEIDSSAAVSHAKVKGKGSVDINKGSDQAIMSQRTSIEPVTALNSAVPTGCIGKLCVRSSGRVVLQWGNQSLALSRGSESDFLQDIIVNNRATLNGGNDGEDDTRFGGDTLGPVWGDSFALGQIGEKFIVAVDWAELFG